LPGVLANAWKSRRPVPLKASTKGPHPLAANTAGMTAPATAEAHNRPIAHSRKRCIFTQASAEFGCTGKAPAEFVTLRGMELLTAPEGG
jgi:hypothetical protein